MNKTKIIATLGPATQSEEKIVELIQTGMNVARINLSHGDRESHTHFIDLVKRARRTTGSYSAILLDTRGPEIRVIDLKEPLELKAGESLTITSDHRTCSKDRIGVDYPGLTEDVQPGNRILLDDGKLALLVEKIDNGDVFTRVLVSGSLSSRKRVSLPDCQVNLPSLSEKDKLDIAFGVEQRVDFIATSFVRKADDVWAVRKILEENGGNQAIIAKIENRQGVENLDEILQAAEGLMVARGDLGVEMPAEEVPVIQKKIIRAANLIGKPVITATQMLDSMTINSRPTRAEVTDVSTAIGEGTDAVMLSQETATGNDPVNVVRTMATIISEEEHYSHLDRNQLDQLTDQNVSNPVLAAVAGFKNSSATMLLDAEGSLYPALSKWSRIIPSILVTKSLHVARYATLYKNIIPLIIREEFDRDQMVFRAMELARKTGVIKENDLISVVEGPRLTQGGIDQSGALQIIVVPKGHQEVSSKKVT